MQILFIAALCLHLLASTFWAGSTFTLARTSGLGAERLFRPQMGAATLTVLAGIYLWHVARPAGMPGVILAIGALCAIAAAGVQGAIGGRAARAMRNGSLPESAISPRLVLAQRLASPLLVIAILCMAAARFT